ncbi:MAG: F0F1 ATP synthase subunit epsilon [Chromatiales bacterium]|jgi:F-type H+-transporting ATPase subunit epsilon
MKHFRMRLLDSTHSQEIAHLTSFVGEDASGSFGILAGHSRIMTLLRPGLARYRIDERPWVYLALPGALLYFKDNLLTLSTRRYLLDEDYRRISQALREQLLAEEEKLVGIKRSLHRMEESVMRKLWEMGREG